MPSEWIAIVLPQEVSFGVMIRARVFVQLNPSTMSWFGSVRCEISGHAEHTSCNLLISFCPNTAFLNLIAKFTF